jgi:hypothetical protein
MTLPPRASRATGELAIEIARNLLLGCQMQCNGVFEGEFQTKEEARAWLESRNLL